MKFVGPINNARVHYSLLTWSTIAAEAQKKKKKKDLKRKLVSKPTLNHFK